MSTQATIPMLAPDGSIGDIPAAQVAAAAKAGFQIGKEVDLNGQKGVIPFSKYGDFMKQHGAITGPQAPVTDDSPKGFAQSLVAPIPLAARGIVHAFTDAPRSAEEAASIGGGIPSTGGLPSRIASALSGHTALGLKRLLVDPSMQAASQATQDVGRGEYGAATFDALKAIPGLGNLLGVGEQAGTQAASGDKLGAAGTVLGNILPIAMTEGMNRGVVPRGTPAVSEAEMGARAIAKAINPSPKAMAGVIDAIRSHGPDINDYIKAKNLDVTGVLGYSKAARGAADEAYQQYRQFADPVSDKLVRVPDGSGVATTDNPANTSFPHAKIADVEKRIGDINKMTFRDDGSTTLDSERKFALQAEHAALTNTLHDTIAKYVGGDITPDDVASLRQKFGKLNTIADATESAVNSRTGIEANIAQGTRFGQGMHSATGAAMEVANHIVRGGANKIADKALRNAIRATDLPSARLNLGPDTVVQSSSSRLPVARPTPLRAMSEPSTVFDATPDDAAAQAISSKIAGRVGLRESLARSNQAKALQEFIHANSLEQAAQDASSARSELARPVRAANKLSDYLSRTGGKDYRGR